MPTETITFRHADNKALALKLHDWHGGQHTGVYSIASCLLAHATNRDTQNEIFFHPEEQTLRAIAELESRRASWKAERPESLTFPPLAAIYGPAPEDDDIVELDALVAELRRRFIGVPVLDEFTHAYIECALWTCGDEEHEQFNECYGLNDIAPHTLDLIIAECLLFQRVNGEDINAGPENPKRASGPTAAGHDFWLTRNGHGAGFWDGDWPEPAATRLTDASKKFRETSLYKGDDGKLYLE